MPDLTREILDKAHALKKATYRKKREPRIRQIRLSSFGIDKKIPLTIVKEEVIHKNINQGQII